MRAVERGRAQERRAHRGQVCSDPKKTEAMRQRLLLHVEVMAKWSDRYVRREAASMRSRGGYLLDQAAARLGMIGGGGRGRHLSGIPPH